MASPGDVGRCLCPQRASPHLSRTGALFSKSGPCRRCTTTSASESSEIHPGESAGAPDKCMGFRAQKSLLVSPSVALCALPATGFHTGIIVSHPVTKSWSRVHLSRKSLSRFNEHNDRDYCYPSSRLPQLSAFLGRCKGRVPTRQHIQKYTLNGAKSTMVQPLTITFDLQYKPLFVPLPASRWGFQAVLQQCSMLSWVLAAHSILNTNSRELLVWNVSN